MFFHRRTFYNWQIILMSLLQYVRAGEWMVLICGDRSLTDQWRWLYAKCNYNRGDNKVSKTNEVNIGGQTSNTNINGLWVWISTVFNIFGHFPFKEGHDNPGSCDLHTIWCLSTKGTRIYMVYGLGFQTFDFKKFRHFLFKGDQDHPGVYDLRTILYPLTQGTRINTG